MPAKIVPRGNGKYLLQVSAGYANGKQILRCRTITAKNPDDAEKKWHKFLAEVERGEVTTAKKKTLKQFYEYWKQHHAEKRQEAGTREYNDQIFKRIDDGLGHLRVDKIEPRHLLDFYANLAEPGIRKDIKKDKDGKPLDGQKLTLSATTIRKHHTLIHTLLKAAVKWGFATYNAADRVEAPRAEKTTRKILDEAQTARFLELLEKEETKHKLLVYLGLTGGLCREEIFGLEWKDLDLTAGTIRIDRASVYVAGKGVITKDCKNTHRHRLVSVPPATVDLLKAHRADQASKRLKLGGTKDKGGQWAGAEDPEDDRVLTTWVGAAAHPHGFNSWLRRFCDDNGLPNPGTHGFRHLAATFLITKCGADVRTVAGKLGHANPQTTISIYSHLLQSAEQETATAMQKVLESFKPKVKLNK